MNIYYNTLFTRNIHLINYWSLTTLLCSVKMFRRKDAHFIYSTVFWCNVSGSCETVIFRQNMFSRHIDIVDRFLCYVTSTHNVSSGWWSGCDRWWTWNLIGLWLPPDPQISKNDFTDAMKTVFLFLRYFYSKIHSRKRD